MERKTKIVSHMPKISSRGLKRARKTLAGEPGEGGKAQNVAHGRPGADREILIPVFLRFQVKKKVTLNQILLSGLKLDFYRNSSTTF